MRGMEKLVRILPVCIVGAACLAQSVPICCKILYEWETDVENDDPCEGTFTLVCEDSVTASGVDPEDPLAMIRRPGKRDALCYLVDVGEQGTFVKGPCDTPPDPDAVLIAPLPDGTCCWAENPIEGVDITEIPQTFDISRCEDDCSGDPN